MTLASLAVTALLATPVVMIVPAVATPILLATPTGLAAPALLATTSVEAAPALAAPPLLATTSVLAAPMLAAPARPDTVVAARAMVYPPSAAETIIKSIYRERERTEKWFQSNNESFLAAVQRKDFAGQASLTIGSGEDCDVRVQDGLLRPHHLRVTLTGDSFRVQALDDSALFKVGDVESRDTIITPNSVSIGKRGAMWGRYQLRIWHQRQPGVILFDAQSPRFNEYRGLKNFPVDLKYRFGIQLEPNPNPDTISIASTRGPNRPAVRLGWFNFMIGETPCRLALLRLIDPGLPPDYAAVFFRDATSGKETSAIGRYAEARPLGSGGRYLIDFNTARNPACAFSSLYNCPIPPDENTLKVPIPAGEKDLGYLTAKK